MPFSLDPDRTAPQKELGGFLGLFDKPPYRDWLAWWTAFCAVVSGLAIAFPTREVESTAALPRWLDVSLAVVVFTVLFGLAPAYIRFLLRRWLIKRRPRSSTERRPAPAQPA